jgi:hypothetical protein
MDALGTNRKIMYAEVSKNRNPYPYSSMGSL